MNTVKIVVTATLAVILAVVGGLLIDVLPPVSGMCMGLLLTSLSITSFVAYCGKRPLSDFVSPRKAMVLGITMVLVSFVVLLFLLQNLATFWHGFILPAALYAKYLGIGLAFIGRNSQLAKV